MLVSPSHRNLLRSVIGGEGSSTVHTASPPGDGLQPQIVSDYGQPSMESLDPHTQRLRVLRSAGIFPVAQGRMGSPVTVNNSPNATHSLLEQGADPNLRTGPLGRTPIHLAIASGDFDKAQRLKEQGADPNIADFNGDTALHLACSSRDSKAIAALIDLGADVDLDDKNGQKPLYRAIRAFAALDDIRALIDAGADVNAENRLTRGESFEGWNDFTLRRPVMHLVGDYEFSPYPRRLNFEYLRKVGQLLLEKGAKPDKIDLITGDTPLHVATRRGNTALIDLLIGNNAKTDTRNYRGERPIDFARRLGFGERFISRCEQGAFPTDQRLVTRYSSPSGVASASGPLSRTGTVSGSKPATAARRVSAAGTPNENSRPSYGPLRPNAEYRNDRVVGHFGWWSSFFRGRGYVDYRIELKALPPVYRACDGYNLAVLEVSKLNEILQGVFRVLGAAELNNDGITAVFLKGLHPERLRPLVTLVDNGLFNARFELDGELTSPTTGHIIKTSLSLPHRIAALGVEPPEGVKGVSLFDRFYALRQAGISLSRTLNKHGEVPLHFAARFGNLASVRALVKCRVDPDAQCKAGYTPLMLAAQQGRCDIVSELLGAGANPELRCLKDQFSALHRAVIKGGDAGRAVARALLEAGARPTSQSIISQTPYHLAVSSGDLEMLKILLTVRKSDEQRKAVFRPNVTNKDGQTPLHLACSMKREDMAALLIKHGAVASLSDRAGQTPWALARKAEAPDSMLQLLTNRLVS